MKSKKLLTIIVFVLLVGCLSPIVLAKPATNSVKAVGKGTVTREDGTIINSKMLLVAQINAEPNSEGDYEGTADIVMNFVLPDGTKITAFRDIPFIVDVDDGVLQGFTLEINGKLVPITITIVKNKVYGTLITAIIAHESTHIVDYYLRMRIRIEGVHTGPDA